MLTALSGERNGLNHVRLTLAGAVLVSHSWLMVGRGPGPSVAGEDLGAAAVAGFFAISGYLITGSRLTLSLPRFLWHRFLRIFPGYWAVLLVTAFGFAPGLSAVAGEHWTPGAGVDYVAANWTTRLNELSLPGTLQHLRGFPPGASAPWNRSLWTLFYELACYLAIGLTLCLPRLRRSPWTAATALVLASAGVWALNDIRSPDLQAMCRLGAPFAAGALLRQLGDRVPVGRWPAAGCALACLAAGWFSHLSALGALPLAYLVLWVGAHWRTRGRPHVDLSYGVYIYAFPVQRMLADLHVATGQLLLLIVVSGVLVGPLAYGSWVLVERPCLQAKSWTPVPPRWRLPGSWPPLVSRGW